MIVVGPSLGIKQQKKWVRNNLYMIALAEITSKVRDPILAWKVL